VLCFYDYKKGEEMAKKQVEKRKIPKSVRTVLVVAFVMYLWFFISALLIPISQFLPLPEQILLSVYKMLNFPVSLLGFIFFFFFISSVIIMLHFHKQTGKIKFFLIEGTSMIMYYIIPIIATLLVLALIVFRIAHAIPSAERISHFLEDMFLFTTVLFVMTAVLNIAVHRFLKIKGCCDG
jgi:hypothetical protein